ncbi:MAG: helix-turn-helix domain-containing protein [Candidatus Bathyarchaeota archaeon]|nr:MAG: helix-turn-helix domain-containing protein [Candidatus Bathyarchaeota archaeon]
MTFNDSIQDMLARRIAGEIVLSASPGATMRKWRSLLQVSQVEVAQELELSPSVVSDYETGRRRSPGSNFIKRFVEALLKIEERRGGRYIQQMARIMLAPEDVFLDMREFVTPTTIGEMCKALQCEVLIGEEAFDQEVYGYTIIDSLRAIQTLSGLDFYRIFGTTSERALVFVGVSRGRSPMIAVKISPFKPRIIVLHGIVGMIDPLAVSLARNEGIPLAVSKLPTQDDVVAALLGVYRLTQE